ncbi:MAG: alpha/beta fold hydrolase [Candidatus Caldarchaeum sp.]|nr:alpha/beta fold hydrolase [Candidatus Caldarchaeum sp.]MDW8436319.1 alpha/beta fold hydrolase [Candidatus Caldarchaeum sp.]
MVGLPEHVKQGIKAFVDGVEVFSVEKGVGEPVVLIHGWASSSYSWRRNIAALAEHFRVIALDLPGFGLSQKLPNGLRLKSVNDFLLKFLEKIGVERFNLVGMSMGGAISIYKATSNPETVKKLVLINPALFGAGAGRRRAPAKLLSIRPFYDIFSRVFMSKRFIRNVLKQVYVKRSLVDDELVEAYYQSVKLSGKTLVEAFSLMEDFDLGLTSKIRCPVLFILGGLDNLVPVEKNREIAERMGAKIFVDPESGHGVHEENPEAVNNALLNFLKG